MPILKAAQEAVLKIDKTQLNIIKSYINPPNLVVMVLKACCLLYGYEENWENSKRYLLGDIRFLEKLIEYDVSTAAEIRFVKLREQYFKKEEFKREYIIKQSEAAGCIYQWLIAIDQYQKVNKIVAPKEKKLLVA
jgi:dynein heavy chain, axonemal